MLALGPGAGKAPAPPGPSLCSRRRLGGLGRRQLQHLSGAHPQVLPPASPPSSCTHTPVLQNHQTAGPLLPPLGLQLEQLQWGFALGPGTAVLPLCPQQGGSWRDSSWAAGSPGTAQGRPLTSECETQPWPPGWPRWEQSSWPVEGTAADTGRRGGPRRGLGNRWSQL